MTFGLATIPIIGLTDGNATLLQNCTTYPTIYYDVQHASQLNSVFTPIARNLANQHMAK